MTVTRAPRYRRGARGWRHRPQNRLPGGGGDEDPGHDLDLEFGRRLKRITHNRHLFPLAMGVRGNTVEPSVKRPGKLALRSPPPLWGRVRVGGRPDSETSAKPVHGGGIGDNDSNQLPRLGERPLVRGGAGLCGMLGRPDGPGFRSARTNQGRGASPAPPAPVGVGSRSKPENILNSLGNPAAILVVTGQQDGYIEPCGCSEDQEGGLIRRYDLIDRIHKRNWPTAQIDLGSLIKDPAGARGGIRAGEDQVRPRRQGTQAARV